MVFGLNLRPIALENIWKPELILSLNLFDIEITNKHTRKISLISRGFYLDWFQFELGYEFKASLVFNESMMMAGLEKTMGGVKGCGWSRVVVNCG
ncbi:hypothetical protein L1987_26998 [Smallanthus sonchifolius]|uniref:Uncharacterized protein n=1 Tax=Smallanthus sonchifolius TaxID=185202 RepID=A0ACB9IC19_9ASTR|nr:hypothetical protein L1987_26998 [Smallanthus sonchifolius]